MGVFQSISITWKLKLIIMLTSVVVLLVTATAFVVYDRIAFKEAMTHDLSALAEIIGMNSRAALAFQDRQFAENALGALAAKPHVAFAIIYDSSGRAFARYRRDGEPYPWAMAANHCSEIFLDAKADVLNEVERDLAEGTASRLTPKDLAEAAELAAATPTPMGLRALLSFLGRPASQWMTKPDLSRALSDI